MEKVFSDAFLLWCLNKESVPYVVLGYDHSCGIYTTKMEPLCTVNLPFKPSVYAVISEDGILVFGFDNRMGLIDTKEGTFTNITAPSGTSDTEMLSCSHLIKVDDGFVFLTPNAGARKYSFHYSPLTNKFKRIKIELPRIFSSVNTLGQGAYCYKDEQGDIHFCSFETAYREKKFVSEMLINKAICARCHDIFEISSEIAYFSLEKKTILFVSPDKPDITALIEHKRNAMLGKEGLSADSFGFIEMPNSGELILVKDNEIKKEVKLGYRPYIEDFKVSMGSVVLVGHSGHIDVYDAEDLSLLASLPISFGPRTVFIPEGMVAYENNGNTYVSDFPPLFVVFEALKEKNRP